MEEHQASRSEKASELLTFDELPVWLQDNHFILGSYRGPSYSVRESIGSILALHTESVNIHTHLWGAAAVLVGTLPVYQSISTRYPSFTAHDTIAFGIWFFCAFLCLGLSATYHAICNHSPEVNAMTQKFDHLGIIIMTCGSFLSMIYYGWYCEPTLAYTFSVMIISLSAACAFVSANPRTRTPAWRPYRAAMFIGLGLSALVPITSGLRSHGLEGMNRRITLFPWLALEFSCYLLGAILYATRIPERLSPGTFDVFGSSHQIFHFLILFAAGFHLKGLLTTFDWNHQRAAC
ncbi:hemolysin-III channel protein Izh2 [Penicillium hispanicum]|uniref:hemolysin-III channel protein Izh2 n=1 Tax=Penicillium hispanicum TaxID=1080232 RepID=UPI002541518A|nr:hemolysin-III channel protein Izh2 [Penicillium hispanicum]KAJ5584558.1 hemolysin-III channel protein Izh2 [Penicillium hispanicum]